MTRQELIDVLRIAQSRGHKSIKGRLHCAMRGVTNIRLTNLDGIINGNPHDVWVESESGKKVLGRIYLGSKKAPPDTEGWEKMIAEIARGNRPAAKRAGHLVRRPGGSVLTALLCGG